MLSAVSSVMFAAVVLAAGMCLWRAVSPYSSFNEWAAGLGTLGLPGLWPLAKKFLQEPLVRVREFLRARQFNVDRIASFFRWPRVPRKWLIPEVLAWGALLFLYGELQPIRLEVERGAIASLCTEPGNYAKQPFIGQGTNRPQGVAPTENNCPNAFARCYQRLSLRTTPIGHDRPDTLTLSAEGALIAFIVTNRQSQGRLQGATGNPATADGAATFELPEGFTTSGNALEAYFVLEGQPKVVRVTAKLASTLSRRELYVAIPDTDCR